MGGVLYHSLQIIQWLVHPKLNKHIPYYYAVKYNPWLATVCYIKTFTQWIIYDKLPIIRWDSNSYDKQHSVLIGKQ